MFAHLVEMLTAHYFSSGERSAQEVDVILNMTHDVVFQKPFLYVAISIGVVNVNIGRMLMTISMKRRLFDSRRLLRTFISSTQGH